MKKYLLNIILLLIFFISALASLAQNLGITSTGTTTYPTNTIGQTTILGSTAEAQGTLSAQKITIPAGGATIKSISINWASIGSGGTFQFAFYTDNSGNPNAIIAGTATGTITATSGWQTVSYSTPFYLSAGTYWLARQSQNNQVKRNYNLTGGPGRKSLAFAYGAFPASFGVATTSDNLDESEYLTYVKIQGYAKATKAVLASNGIFSSVSFYSHAVGNVRLAIYNDVSGAPSAKQWESGDVAVSATAWTTVNISSGTPASLSLNAGTYWLAWQWNSAASGPSYTVGAAGTGNFIIQSYGAFPSTWSSGTASTENWSMYASYVACTTPTAYNVTGGGGYCSGGSGVAIGLSNSQTNVNYQLFLGASPVGSPVAGTTGSAISFGSNITTAGTYTVTATTATGGCTNNMSNSVTVTINPLPTASAVKTDVQCFQTNTGQITVSGHGGSNSYTYYSISNGLPLPIPNGYSTNPVFTGLGVGQYKIRVIDTNGCESKAVQ